MSETPNPDANGNAVAEVLGNTPPVAKQLQLPEVTLSYFEWGNAADPTLLLVHATGFHARCWDQVVARLPKGVQVVALDMRGHGRSDKLPPYNWDTFGQDLVAFADALQMVDVVGVGHSMGGHCVAQLAAERPHVFRELLLLDPVIFERSAYSSDKYRGYENAADHPVAGRREVWDSWQAMHESLQGKGSFGLWDAQVFEDYCRYGVLPNADGGVNLACPALVEASIYLGNTQTDLHKAIPSIKIPVTVLRAPPRDPDAPPEMDFSKSPTVPELASYFPQGTDVLLPELTHFIPMQAPELVAGYIRQTLTKQLR